MPAALETVEVERDGLHPAVGLGFVEHLDQLPKRELVLAAAVGDFGELDLGRLFDQRAVEVERKHAVLDRRRPGRKRAVQRSEEQQHEDEDQRVLDPDQQLPDCANEFHVKVPNDFPRIR